MKVSYMDATPTVVSGFNKTVLGTGESFFDWAGPADMSRMDDYEIVGGNTLQLKSAVTIKAQELAKAKTAAISRINSGAGRQIIEVGEWAEIRQGNARDGVYGSVVGATTTVVFQDECVKYRIAIIQQSNLYTDSIDAAMDIASVKAILDGVVWNTTGLMTYSEVKNHV